MKAKLVYCSLATRVVVSNDATEGQIIESAREKFMAKVRNELWENIEDIKDDIECPFSPDDIPRMMEFSYDVRFQDDFCSDSKGFAESSPFCSEYIKQNNGTDNSYFADYKGGVVQIVCNETDEVIYEERVR